MPTDHPTPEAISPDSVHGAGGKRHAAWVYEAIKAGSRYHHRTKTPWRHNAVNLACTALVVGVIGTTMWAGQHVAWPLYLPLAAIIFGWAYFGLFILVIHEASHGMFLVGTDRRRAQRWNTMSGWAVSVFFGVHYRKHWAEGHLEHHVRPLEPTDPQRFSLPIGKALASTALRYFFIPGYLFYDRTVGRKRHKGGKSASTRGAIVAFVGIWSVMLPTVTITLGWPVAVAMFWGLHILAIWNLAKGGLEHGGAIGQEPDPMFRSRTSLFPGRRLIMPFNITLHFEHHLNFTVPWYDLWRFHKELRAIAPPEVWQDVINNRPLRQLQGRMKGLSPAARALTLPAPSPPAGTP